MEYRTLMVRLELERDNDAVLRVTAELAQSCESAVIGIAACQPIQAFLGGGHIPPQFVREDRAEIESQIGAAEQQFRRAFANSGKPLEWRPIIDYRSLSRCIAHQARSADVIVTAPDRGTVEAGTGRRVDIGDLVMRLGRPMLIVPDNQVSLSLGNAVVGWKDTRESRRAAADALPLLRRVRRVVVIRICGSDEFQSAQSQLHDVAAWYERQGVTPEMRVFTASGPDSRRLAEIAEEIDAGFIVTGAYGHSRLREWVFGGVTRDYLSNPARPMLVSH